MSRGKIFCRAFFLLSQAHEICRSVNSLMQKRTSVLATSNIRSKISDLQEENRDR